MSKFKCTECGTKIDTAKVKKTICFRGCMDKETLYICPNPKCGQLYREDGAKAHGAEENVDSQERLARKKSGTVTMYPSERSANRVSRSHPYDRH
ncbi:MAG: hypothetical protein WC565_00870 [Parcubacteria group bacterium]